ncbi:MAG: hypothetical protein H7196_03355 [candidate division SR1 bacterium]|nr:hypothetical protein [candidate division SR1 bacterium]
MFKVLTSNKFTNIVAQIFISKLQKDYYRKFQSELPIVRLSRLKEKNIEILFIKKLFKANGWSVFTINNTNKIRLLFESIKQKNTVLIGETDTSSLEMEVEVARGPKFLLTAMNKYTFDDQYLWPKSSAKIVSMLEKLQSKYDLNKVSIQDIVGKIDLPPHTFDIVKGKVDITVIDNTIGTDFISLQCFLDTFEEIVNIYSHANFDSPEYENNMVIPPKHTIILEEMSDLNDISITEYNEILERLVSLRKKYNDFLEEIYLVGSEWLKCDEQGFAKKDGVIAYIRYDNHTFKAVDTANDLEGFFSDDSIRPHSWFWIKGSKKLSDLRFELTK